MSFYKPDFGKDPNSPFARDANNILVRKNYWQDMDDNSIILILTNGIGKILTNEQKRLHLKDIKRDHLEEQICIQEVLPPED